MDGNTREQFFCGECGTHRDMDDRVTEIDADGTGLCYRCNKSLEAELGKGSPEQPMDVLTVANSPRGA